MKKLDQEYDSVVEALETRERDILRHLQQFIVAESSIISKLVTVVARVDAILSLANFAHNFNLVKPEVVEDRLALKTKTNKRALNCLLTHCHVQNPAIGRHSISI